MGTTTGRPAPRWPRGRGLGRLAVIGGLAIGAWFTGAAIAQADSGESVADLVQQVIAQADSGADIGDLVDAALGGTAPEQAPPAQQAPARVSSAEGSADSAAGAPERENTTADGGVDYGPGQVTDPGRPGGTAAETRGTAENAAPATTPRSPPAPKPAAPPARTRPAAAQAAAAPVAVRHTVTEFTRLAEATEDAEEPAVARATADGHRTEPAERPIDPPAPAPAPSAPTFSPSPGSAADGGGHARGALGVLSTRAHHGPPSGGWPIAFPQVPGAAVEAADAPMSRPD